MILRKKRTTEEDRAKAAARARAKRRKKLIRTKYGQTPLRHARKGMYSCMYAMLALALLILLLVTAFLAKGEVGVITGIAGLGAAALFWNGLAQGIRGMKERDKNYMTCKVGIAVNGVCLLGMAAIFIRGLM